jgi:hypothetical protein
MYNAECAPYRIGLIYCIRKIVKYHTKILSGIEAGEAKRSEKCEAKRSEKIGFSFSLEHAKT